jgi:hypothetical protein
MFVYYRFLLLLVWILVRTCIAYFVNGASLFIHQISFFDQIFLIRLEISCCSWQYQKVYHFIQTDPLEIPTGSQFSVKN